MPQSVEQLAADLVKAATCWVPAPTQPITAYPNTMVTSVVLPSGEILALLKYPDPTKS